MKSILVFVVGVLSFLYILNPGFGVFELISDLIPVLGNIDEAAATALLISSLAYFGIDIKDIFERKDKGSK